MGDVLYQFFGFAFFNDTQLTLFQLQLGTGIEKARENNALRMLGDINKSTASGSDMWTSGEM